MNYAEYVGIPFKDAGRERDGCDCWGLVRLVLQERFGKTLPAFDDYEKSTRDESERQVAMGLKALNLQRVETPQEGDIALMRIRGALSHVGLYLGGGEILHTMRGTYSVIESASSYRLCTKIEGYYRVG